MKDLLYIFRINEAIFMEGGGRFVEDDSSYYEDSDFYIETEDMEEGEEND